MRLNAKHVLLNVVSDVGDSEGAISVEGGRKCRVYGTEWDRTLLLHRSIRSEALGSLVEGLRSRESKTGQEISI